VHLKYIFLVAAGDEICASSIVSSKSDLNLMATDFLLLFISSSSEGSAKSAFPVNKFRDCSGHNGCVKRKSTTHMGNPDNQTFVAILSLKHVTPKRI